jgi:hypothetical protein
MTVFSMPFSIGAPAPGPQCHGSSAPVPDAPVSHDKRHTPTPSAPVNAAAGSANRRAAAAAPDQLDAACRPHTAVRTKSSRAWSIGRTSAGTSRQPRPHRLHLAGVAVQRVFDRHVRPRRSPSRPRSVRPPNSAGPFLRPAISALGRHHVVHLVRDGNRLTNVPLRVQPWPGCTSFLPRCRQAGPPCVSLGKVGPTRRRIRW